MAFWYWVFHLKYVPLHPQKCPLRWLNSYQSTEKERLSLRKGRCSSFLYVCALLLKGGKMALMRNETINIFINNII